MRLAPALRDLLALPERQRRLGPFVLVQQLGRGGFAPVWLAKEVYGETELRTAAVKLFSLDQLVAASAGSRTSSAGLRGEQVIEEARALCQVEHPNIVRFYSLLVDEARRVIGLAMEYLAGDALDARLSAEGKLSLDETLSVGVSVASALAAVHVGGLVHRDVKPANVIESAGVYKLIDFGIAAADHRALRPSGKRVEDDLPFDDELPSAPAVGDASTLLVSSGTLGYVDPESVASGAAATPASDLYALGVLLFECLTGKLPAAASAREGGGLDRDVLEGRAAPPSLAEVSPGAPPGLVRVVDALLSPSRDARPRSAELVAHELERVRREQKGRSRPLPPEDVGPFRGLARFELADRDLFFGRAIEIAASLEALRSRGLVALVGPSGSGKSSLARAGVLAAVIDGAIAPWPRAWDAAIASPGADPRAAIGAALEPLLAGAAARSPDSLAAALAARVESTGRGVILLVDQLEELAAAPEGESRAWAASLLALLGRRAIPGVRALCAARRELLDSLLAFGELGPAIMRGSLLVTPISEAAWGEALEQSLDAYGYGLEDETFGAELMAELRGTLHAMPLCELALTRLWERRDREAKRLTRAGLREIGGIAGALERHAEATLEALTAARPDALEVVQTLMLALTTAQGTRATRGALELERLGDPEATHAALRALEEARLVVSEASGLTLASDALLKQWGRLRAWIAMAREDRVLAEALEADAERFQAIGDPALVWKRERLGEAAALQRRGGVPISPRAATFIAAGLGAEKRVNRVALGIAAAFVAAAAVGLALYVRGISLEQEKTDAALAQAREAQRHAELETREAKRQKDNAELAREDADQARRDDAELGRRFRKRSERFQQELKALETRIGGASAAELGAVQKDLHERSASPESEASIPSGQAHIGGASMSGGRVDGALSVIAAMTTGFRGCYRRALEADDKLRGAVQITVMIGPSGDVDGTAPGVSEGLPEPLVRCLRSRIARSHFTPPEPQGTAKIVIPVSFEVGVEP